MAQPVNRGLSLGAGPLVEATVATADIAADLVLWNEVLGYHLTHDGPLADDEVGRWGTDALRGNRVVRLAPADGRIGGVRLVEQPMVPGYRALRTYGWAAIEVIVDDLAALETSLAATCAVLGRPAQVGGRQSGLLAMQVLTPGATPLYVTEVRSAPAGFDLPRATSPVGPVFIAVVATPDLVVTRQFFEDRFRLTRVTDHELPVRVLNTAFGLDEETRHRVSSVQLAGQSVIEIDQYPAEATQRPAALGCLPHGVAFVTIAVPNAPPVGSLERGPFGLLIEAIGCPPS